MKNAVRKPVIAGSWYPDIPDILRRDIAGYVDKASVPDIPRKPVAIISPHAGYMYSGRVAGHSYRAVQGRSYSTVVVISPSHRAYFPAVSGWARGSFETPLGAIEVDEALCADLLAGSSVFTDNTRPHDSEHALEIQLPFLQTVRPPFRLCPLLMGQQDPDLCRELSQALRSAIRDPDDTLIVASSDLSHFHPAGQAENMDARVAAHIESLDIDGLHSDLCTGQAEACGGGPIITALSYARSLARTGIQVLKYAHSGHITGDNASVVGYLSAVVY
jgi:AmmeMemoRadiSam system protein B